MEHQSCVSLAVLLTCHNRRDLTLRCLAHLAHAHATATANGWNFALSIYLVDDGSSDGTADHVTRQFPQAKIIRGDGQLYWNRGMHLAWQVASGDGHAGFLWLNDDTLLRPAGLLTLVRVAGRPENWISRAVVVAGTCVDPSSGRWTYGGYRGRQAIEQPVQSERIERFNGNVVFVSRAAFERTGNLDPYFRHSFGDMLYGLSARRNGVDCLLAPEVIAECRPGEVSSWCNPDVAFRNRLRHLLSPKGCPPLELVYYSRQISPWRWPLVLGKLALRVAMPRLFKGKISA